MRFRFLALAVLALLSCGWIGMGGRVASVTPTPSAANIPVASLANGSYSANNWTGFTTNATTVSTTSSNKYIQTTTNSHLNTLAIGTASWRDAEITFFFTQGRAILRGGSGSTGVSMSLGINGGGLRIGLVNNINYNDPESGTVNLVYIQTNPASCITNWPTDPSHTFTFGMRGFEVYLLIDGQPAYDTCQSTQINPLGEIRYYEYRAGAQNAGNVSVWAHGGSLGGGVGNQITATYYSATSLYSNYAANTFDIRDFGARSITAVTGSMSSGSCTLTLSGARDFRVRDRIIVEIGGESGAGARNTVGVGGTSPELHYADAATRNADTSKPNNTYSYLDTDGSTAIWNSSAGAWQTTPGSTAFPVGAIYYGQVKAPVSLRATVVAVDSSPATTLTLKTFGADADANCTKVATSGANVYLDSLPSFYPMTTNPAETFVDGSTNGATSYQNMTLTIPSGTWYVSGVASATVMVTGGRSGLTVTGQGLSSTTVRSPKGVPSKFIFMGAQNSTVTVQDLTYHGNLGDNGYMWEYTGTNKNFPGDTPIAIAGGALASDVIVQRVKCLNDLRGCAVLEGTNPQILNSEVEVTVGQRAYFQWKFMLSNCTGGQINGITATGAYLLKSAELFACNGATMTNLTGTNMLVSVNSSTSSTLSNIDTTIQTDAFFDQLSGWLDEPVISINQNAFGSGHTGTLSNFRIVQQGYTQVSSKRSLKAIQLIGGQNDWTISGSYPGGGGCTSALGGYIETPNYDATSGSSYGAMGVYSGAARTIVTGIRVVGTAIGSPGLSSHYGNISITGTSNQANNNVADVIQPGPTTSGNQTNATFCP